MNKEIPKTIKSFEHIYYLDEEVQRLVEKYNSDEMINRIMQENKQLKEELESKKKMYWQQQCAYYSSILYSLEEWLKVIMENASLKWGDNCAREFDLGCLDIEMTMKNYGEVLNKIQELKEKYK